MRAFYEAVEVAMVLLMVGGIFTLAGLLVKWAIEDRKERKS